MTDHRQRARLCVNAKPDDAVVTFGGSPHGDISVRHIQKAAVWCQMQVSRGDHTCEVAWLSDHVLNGHETACLRVPLPHTDTRAIAFERCVDHRQIGVEHQMPRLLRFIIAGRAHDEGRVVRLGRSNLCREPLKKNFIRPRGGHKQPSIVGRKHRAVGIFCEGDLS